MLGHRLWLDLCQRGETYATIRGRLPEYAHMGLFDSRRVVDQFEARDLGQLQEVFRRSRPDVVFNAAARIRTEAENPFFDVEINSILPHRLALLCSSAGARLIHVSTDGVFSGKRGKYTEGDQPDAEDHYGRTKALGEIGEPWALTVRVCPVGRELVSARSLVEWFLAQRGRTVRGYVHARFSGLTTPVVARILGDIAERHHSIWGVRHLSGSPLNKFEFLRLLNEHFGCGAIIEPDESHQVDRTLDSSRLEREVGFAPPAWDDMLRALRDDPLPYDRFHRSG
jgi:dTDP-4-dehydrorhamnose reductase